MYVGETLNLKVEHTALDKAVATISVGETLNLKVEHTLYQLRFVAS